MGGGGGGGGGYGSMAQSLTPEERQCHVCWYGVVGIEPLIQGEAQVHQQARDDGARAPFASLAVSGKSHTNTEKIKPVCRPDASVSSGNTQDWAFVGGQRSQPALAVCSLRGRYSVYATRVCWREDDTVCAKSVC